MPKNLIDAFKRLQLEFYKRGFLVVLKEDDYRKFADMHKKPDRLMEKCRDIMDRFGLEVGSICDLFLDVDDIVTLYSQFISKEKRAEIQEDYPGDWWLMAAEWFIEESTTDDQICLCLLHRRLARIASEFDHTKRDSLYYLMKGFSERCGHDPGRISAELADKEGVGKTVDPYICLLKEEGYMPNRGGIVGSLYFK